jgi:protein SCO1
MRPATLLLAILGIVLAADPAPAGAQMFPPLFRDIGIDQHLGAQLPLDAQFRDQNGTPVRLGDFFHDKPVLLVPVYYTCTTLCDETLRGLVEGISHISQQPGTDYEIVAFSFNPDETPVDALKKYKECTRNFAGNRSAPGWHFLTGKPDAIAALTSAIGFHYRYDPENHIYVHAAGMMIATPDGRLSRYLFGVTFQPKDLQDGLLISAQHHVAAKTPVARLLCYPFTAGAARYNSLVLLILRWTAAAMLLALAGGLFFLWRADLRSRFRVIATRRGL